MSTVDNDFISIEPNAQSSTSQNNLMMTPVPYGDDKVKQTILPIQNTDEQFLNEPHISEIANFKNSNDDALNTSVEVVNDTTFDDSTHEPKAEDLQLDFGDGDSDENMPFAYLENEHNLQFPKLSADSIDEQKPHSSFQAVGDWLKQATDLRTYWNALESFGEDVAQYKWAYDEGKMGEFDAATFSKEALKASTRGFTSDNLRMIGNVLSAFGANIENKNFGIGAMTAGATLFVPEAGTLLKNIGDKFQQYAEKVDTSSVLAPMQTAYNNEPSWEKLANVLGQGSAQVLSMGTMAKYIGAAPTYALFAGGGAAQVFNESYDKEQNINTANTLALLSGGATFAIDKIFNPLPKQIENRAKMTSKMIAKEILGAPLREAGTEVLQQLLAENLVRQVGIDDTQDLFEGLVESAIGAIAGTSALMAADGTVYYAQKSYENARRRMLLKGVSDEDIELFKKNAMDLLQSKPDAFSKVFSYSLEQNLKALEYEASQAKPIERSVRKADVAAFRKIYDEMYQRAFQATHDETKAKITASMIQANIMAFYNVDKSFSPQKILLEGLPEIKKMTYEKFKQQTSPEAKLLFQFGGVGAKNADILKLKQAYAMEAKKANPRAIWARTGWYHGSDGKWRFEIDDSKAKLKFDFNVNENDLPKHYWKSYIQKLEAQEAQEIINLREFETKVVSDAEVVEEIYNNIYNDFIDFLDKNYNGHFSYGVNRNGEPSFTDPEAAFESDIKQRQEKIDNNVETLVSSYSARYNTNKLKQNGSESAYIRDKTLKQLLIDRDKFEVLEDEDIANLTSANENREKQGEANRFSRFSNEDSTQIVDENIKTGGNRVVDVNPSDAAVVVQTSNYKDISAEEFNVAMDSLLNSYHGMKIFNPSLNKEIEIKKSSTDNLSDDVKFLIPYLPILAEKAVFYTLSKTENKKSNSKIKASYYAYLPIEINGKRKNVRIDIHENNKGELFWDLRLKNMSVNEIDGGHAKTDDNLSSSNEQQQQIENLYNSSHASWRKHRAVNTNFQSPDKFYTEEQLKIIRAVLEERSFFGFLSDIWESSLDENANIERLDKFLEENNAKTDGFMKLVQKLDAELIEEAEKRQDAMRRMGIFENGDMMDDLTVNKFYQLYLAGQGDYHKPYFNANYLSSLYRKAHIPLSMSEKFLSLPRYRSWSNANKSLMMFFLDRIYRIYRFHKEIDFAKQAEQRDIQAANEFIKQRIDDGDESLRTYWMQRQLLLDKKEFKLDDLLEHNELYKNYPDLKKVIVRFVELDNNEGYHFYRDKNTENDVLEIDPKQFDYSNLKDLLMKGAAFAIQMREHFDLALTPSQRRNFMDRHFYLAKEKAMKNLGFLLTEFVTTYLPDEKTDTFWVDKEVPLPLLNIYKSQSKKNKKNGTLSSKSTRRLKYKEIDFDLLYRKVDEKYANRILDPHERQLGNFAYSSLREMISRFNNFELVASRISSGYIHTAPFPWAGAVSHGDIEVRSMLQRQNYSDWQRTFAFWDDRIKIPSVDRTKLSFSALHKFTSSAKTDKDFMDIELEKMNSIPDDDDKIKAPFDGMVLVMQKLAKGAYEIADKTIYLFEEADEQTIIHETFHYLSQLFKTSLYNTDSKLRTAYTHMVDDVREMLFNDYKIVKRKGKYQLVHHSGSTFLSIGSMSFATPNEAIDTAIEEFFAQQLWNSLSHKAYPHNIYMDILNYFYCSWLVNISNSIFLNENQYSKAAKNLLSHVDRYMDKALKRLWNHLK